MLTDKVIYRNVPKTHGYLAYSGIDSVVIFNILKLLQNWKIIGSKRKVSW